eukprot:5344128-Amphidinium_carterae.1
MDPELAIALAPAIRLLLTPGRPISLALKANFAQRSAQISMWHWSQLSPECETMLNDFHGAGSPRAGVGAGQ